MKTVRRGIGLLLLGLVLFVVGALIQSAEPERGFGEDPSIVFQMLAVLFGLPAVVLMVTGGVLVIYCLIKGDDKPLEQESTTA